MQIDTAARTGQTDKTDRLISSDKVDGTSVYNRNGDNIGTINHLMIDKISGQVEFAVMSTGGFLGIGESYSGPDDVLAAEHRSPRSPVRPIS